MRTEVMYRDLPGGPLQLSFTDELPLCMFCSKCGMLSKDMFEDPNSHAFCSVCIFESSDRKKIHCKHENKEVSLDQMVPAIDIITIIMDQQVYCPNKTAHNSCKRYYCLKDLEGHYLECEETKICCLTCGDNVTGREWGDHAKSCPQQILQCCYCVVAVPRWKLEDHERVCNENPSAIREDAAVFTTPRDPPTSPTLLSQNQSKPVVHENESQKFKAPEGKGRAAANTSSGDEITECPVCNRKVKNKNLNRHMDVCLKSNSSPPINSTRRNEADTLEIRRPTEPAPKSAPAPSESSGWPDEFQQVTKTPSPRILEFLESQTRKTWEPVPNPGLAQASPPASHEWAQKFDNLSTLQPSAPHGESQTPPQASAMSVIHDPMSDSAHESHSVYRPQELATVWGRPDEGQTKSFESREQESIRSSFTVISTSKANESCLPSEDPKSFESQLQDSTMSSFDMLSSLEWNESQALPEAAPSAVDIDDITARFGGIALSSPADKSLADQQRPCNETGEHRNHVRGSRGPVVDTQPSSSRAVQGIDSRNKTSNTRNVGADCADHVMTVLAQSPQEGGTEGLSDLSAPSEVISINGSSVPRYIAYNQCQRKADFDTINLSQEETKSISMSKVFDSDTSDEIDDVSTQSINSIRIPIERSPAVKSKWKATLAKAFKLSESKP